MTSALRWAAMRAILMFDNCEGQSHKTVSTDHNFCRERKAKVVSNQCPSAYQPNALPLGQTGSQGRSFAAGLPFVEACAAKQSNMQQSAHHTTPTACDTMVTHFHRKQNMEALEVLFTPMEHTHTKKRS